MKGQEFVMLDRMRKFSMNKVVVMELMEAQVLYKDHDQIVIERMRVFQNLLIQ